MSHYLGDHTALCKTTYGHKMFVDTRDTSLAPHLLEDGEWEMWITAAIGPYVRGATFIDVGANFGWYSLMAEKGKAKSVIAFEPNPVLYKLLRRTMMVNGFEWTILQAALSEKNGSATLNFDEELMGSGSLHEGVGATQVEVATLSFDRLVREERLDDDVKNEGGRYVFKFDVEGFEAPALLGARDFIKSRDCAVFVEHHTGEVVQDKVKEMLDFMDGCEYQLGHIQTDGSIKAIARSDLPSIPDVDMLSFQRFSK